MLVIRLTRRGRRNDPSFRLVVTESLNPVKGKFLEELGFYNPKLKSKSFKQERILYWLSKGVKCSPTVNNLLVSAGVIQGAKVKAWRPKKKQGVAAEAPKAEAKPEKTEETKSEVAEEKAPEVETSEVTESNEPTAESSKTAENKESAAEPAPEVPGEKEESVEEKIESAEPEQKQEPQV